MLQKEGSHTICLNIPVLDDAALVLLLPTKEQWKQAMQEDSDLSVIVKANKSKVLPSKHDLVEKAYHAMLTANQLEVNKGVVYFYECNKAYKFHQLRVTVVPISLRWVVIAACHSSPFAGHSSKARMLYWIKSRFWWPGMSRDVQEGVWGCAHCNLANVASHEVQMQLNMLSCDKPFDVIYLDIWVPGDSIAQEDGGSLMDKSRAIKVLTALDGMTGFAMATFLSNLINPTTMVDAAMCTFFVVMGLPRLIMVDADGIFVSIF